MSDVVRRIVRTVIDSGTELSNWILRAGNWRDEGEWIDTETWND